SAFLRSLSMAQVVRRLGHGQRAEPVGVGGSDWLRDVVRFCYSIPTLPVFHVNQGRPNPLIVVVIKPRCPVPARLCWRGGGPHRMITCPIGGTWHVPKAVDHAAYLTLAAAARAQAAGRANGSIGSARVVYRSPTLCPQPLVPALPLYGNYKAYC